jgi:hypothetical protein
MTFYSPQSGSDLVAKAEAESREAELEQKAARHSQLHPDEDEPTSDKPGGLRSALKRLLHSSR